MRTNLFSIFSHNFIIATLTNFLIMSIYFMLMVTISNYAAARFNADPSTAGLITGAMVIGVLAGRFCSGGLISRFGMKILLCIGLVIYLVFMGLYFIADTPLRLMLVRFFSGCGVGLVGSVTGTIVARVVPENLIASGISYYSLSTIMATATGPFFGLFMMKRFTFEIMFTVCILAGLLSGVLVCFITLTREVKKINKVRTVRKSLSNFIDYRALPISVVVLIAGFGYSSVQTFISSYALELHMMGTASVFFIVYAVTILLTRPVTGSMMDSKGPGIIVYPALLIYATGMLLLSVTQSWWTFLLAGALIGSGFGNFQSIAQAIAIKMVPRQRFGHATSTYFILLDFSLGIGPYLLGLLIPLYGYNGLYLCMSGLALVSLVAYFFLQSKKKFYSEI